MSARNTLLNKPLLQMRPYLYVTAALGHGEFGSVFLVKESSSGPFRSCALKIAVNSNVSRSHFHTVQLHEAAALYCLPHHPNVVPLEAVYEHPLHGLMLQMPSAQCNLLEWLSGSHLSLAERVHVAAQVGLPQHNSGIPHNSSVTCLVARSKKRFRGLPKFWPH